jgi:hypothetical protein
LSATRAEVTNIDTVIRSAIARVVLAGDEVGDDVSRVG